MAANDPAAASDPTGVVALSDDETFDYEAAAELFPTRSRNRNRRFVGYRHFDRAADALRFAIEELPPESLQGAYLEVEEKRFNCQAIRRLYDSVKLPLARRVAA